MASSGWGSARPDQRTHRDDAAALGVAGEAQLPSVAAAGPALFRSVQQRRPRSRGGPSLTGVAAPVDDVRLAFAFRCPKPKESS